MENTDNQYQYTEVWSIGYTTGNEGGLTQTGGNSSLQEFYALRVVGVDSTALVTLMQLIRGRHMDLLPRLSGSNNRLICQVFSFQIFVLANIFKVEKNALKTRNLEVPLGCFYSSLNI